MFSGLAFGSPSAQSEPTPKVRSYLCADKINITMPRKSATVKALWMTQTVCTNLIIYEKDDT